MLILYIGNKNYSSWSLRPWILMRELGIAFEERLIPFNEPGYPAMSSFSPTSKVPTLHDGAERIWESLAIVEYLAERHKGVWAEDPKARAWSRSAAAEMHAGFPVLRDICSMNCGLRIQLHTVSDALKKDLERLAALWGDGLQRFGGPFLAGSKFTAIDAFYSPVAFRAQTYGLKLPAHANDYVNRLLALKGMREWYDAAMREMWRDQPHEDDVSRVGKIVEDYRLVIA